MVDEVVFDEEGKFSGVRSGDETVKAKQLICDPSYVLDVKTKQGEPKVFEEAKVVRAICLLKHPIPSTDEMDSVQLIIPQKQVGRQHDIYITEVSNNHNVTPKDLYVAMVSTIVETSTPSLELEPGYKLLGPILEKFVSVSSIYAPSDSGSLDQIFVTRSYDATSHFETVTDDVKDVWLRAMGTPLELKKRDTTEISAS